MESRKLIWGAVFALIIIASMVHDYYLLGTTSAAVFGLLAAAALFVVWRVFKKSHQFRRVQIAISLVFAASVFSFLAFPDLFFHDLKYFIEDRRIELLTQSQLETVFGSNPKYGNFHSSCSTKKCLVVEIDGTINSQSDFQELRNTIFKNCQHVSSRWLFWNVTIKDASITYNNKCDMDLFPDWGGREHPGNNYVEWDSGNASPLKKK